MPREVEASAVEVVAAAAVVVTASAAVVVAAAWVLSAVVCAAVVVTGAELLPEPVALSSLQPARIRAAAKNIGIILFMMISFKVHIKILYHIPYEKTIEKWQSCNGLPFVSLLLMF